MGTRAGERWAVVLELSRWPDDTNLPPTIPAGPSPQPPKLYFTPVPSPLSFSLVARSPRAPNHPRQALAAMVRLELPHVNVLTKVDLLQEKDKVRLCVCVGGGVRR